MTKEWKGHNNETCRWRYNNAEACVFQEDRDRLIGCSCECHDILRDEQDEGYWKVFNEEYAHIGRLPWKAPYLWDD